MNKNIPEFFNNLMSHIKKAYCITLIFLVYCI